MKIEVLAREALAEQRRQKRRESEERAAINRQREERIIEDARKSLFDIVGDEKAVNELKIEIGTPEVYAYLDASTGKAIGAVFVADGYWQWYAGRDKTRDDLAFNTLEEFGERLSRFRVRGNEYDCRLEAKWLTPEESQPKH